MQCLTPTASLWFRVENESLRPSSQQVNCKVSDTGFVIAVIVQSWGPFGNGQLGHVPTVAECTDMIDEKSARSLCS
jgi:hypothetical protein